MSEAVSALDGAVFDGACRVEDLGPSGMITLRGDLGSAAFKKAMNALAFNGIPERLQINFCDAGAAAWMSPDELMLFCDYDKAGDMVARVEKALGKAHSLVADVSDARAHLRVTGTNVRDVLAKLTPADVSARSFRPGQFRRSRLAQVPGAFWMVDDKTVEIVCFRSVARYVFDILSLAASEDAVVGFQQ